MTRRPDSHTATSPQKKRSMFAANEDYYSLSLKVLPSAIAKIKSQQQREIKAALRDIDDMLYKLIYAENEQANVEYKSAIDPVPQAETETETDNEASPELTIEKKVKRGRVP